MEANGRAPDVQFLGHRYEVAQQAKLHDQPRYRLGIK
jgi:hypothetical protein